MPIRSSSTLIAFVAAVQICAFCYSFHKSNRGNHEIRGSTTTVERLQRRNLLTNNNEIDFCTSEVIEAMLDAFISQSRVKLCENILEADFCRSKITNTMVETIISYLEDELWEPTSTPSFCTDKFKAAMVNEVVLELEKTHCRNTTQRDSCRIEAMDKLFNVTLYLVVGILGENTSKPGQRTRPSININEIDFCTTKVIDTMLDAFISQSKAKLCENTSEGGRQRGNCSMSKNEEDLCASKLNDAMVNAVNSYWKPRYWGTHTDFCAIKFNNAMAKAVISYWTAKPCESTAKRDQQGNHLKNINEEDIGSSKILNAILERVISSWEAKLFENTTEENKSQGKIGSIQASTSNEHFPESLDGIINMLKLFINLVM